MKVAKSIVAAIGSVLAVLAAAFADNVIDVDEMAAVASALVIAVATVYAVYKVPNKED